MCLKCLLCEFFFSYFFAVLGTKVNRQEVSPTKSLVCQKKTHGLIGCTGYVMPQARLLSSGTCSGVFSVNALFPT